MISLIAAHASNLVIGNNNQLPWHISEDLQRFKALTMGHPVIMGRATFESIVQMLGKPLPGRHNYVVSKTLPPRDDVTVCASLEAAIEQAQAEFDEIFIIGGAQIYQYALSSNLVDRMYITRITQTVTGDTYFPQYDTTNWVAINRQRASNSTFEYEFITYDKKDSP